MGALDFWARFVLASLATLILGVVLYMSTHSVASLIFVAMSPLLIVANAAEGRRPGPRQQRRVPHGPL